MAGYQRCRDRGENKRRKRCMTPTEQRLKNTRRCAYMLMCPAQVTMYMHQGYRVRCVRVCVLHASS